MTPDRLETLVTAGFWAFMPVLVTGVVAVVSSRAASGRIPRNQWVGIRTRATMGSDAGWEAGHRAALRLLPLYAAITVLAWAGLAVAVLYAGDNVVHLVGFAVFGVILVVVFFSGFVANRAAKATGGPDRGRGR